MPIGKFQGWTAGVHEPDRNSKNLGIWKSGTPVKTERFCKGIKSMIKMVRIESLKILIWFVSVRFDFSDGESDRYD